jgi:hypothetical protein
MVPEDTNLEEDPSLIAIFFAHQDIPSEVEGSGVYFRIVEVEKEQNEELKNKIIDDFNLAMAASNGFVPKYALIVTWKNMTFPNRRRERELKVSQKTFKLLVKK